ncbi:MAG TPA: cupin domain-containing protein [Gemmataceae bacterium]|nr:cupin domain-containing protein [Gemmataceae bacterium]
MNRFAPLSALALVLGVVPGGTAHDKADDKAAVIFTPKDVKWQDAPPSLPRGAKIAVLEGDPTKEGPFVMRIKMPDGYRVPPHTHPKQERVTVISGTLNIGMGGTFDADKCKAMPAGSFGTWPAGMQHFGWMKGETVLQMHGTGPWSLTYVNPKDDPRNQKD